MKTTLLIGLALLSAIGCADGDAGDPTLPSVAGTAAAAPQPLSAESIETLIDILSWGSDDDATEAATLLLRVGPAAVPHLEAELRGLGRLKAQDDDLARLQGDLLLRSFPSSDSPNPIDRRNAEIQGMFDRDEYLHGPGSTAARIARAIAHCRQVLQLLRG